MNTEQLYSTVAGLKESGAIIFEAVSGSHSHGTNTPQSDLDLRGLFILPSEWHKSIFHAPEEVSIDSQDIKYYELKKFIGLAADCNPTICEMLFPPADCVRVMTPAMEKLIRNRHLFISTKAYHTFSGYAVAQIKKAKGQGKMVHDEGKYEPGIARLQHWMNSHRINKAWVEKHFSSQVCQSVCKGCKVGVNFNREVNTERADRLLLSDQEVLRLKRPHRKDFCWFIPTKRSGLIYGLKTRFLPYMGENKWPVRPEPLEKSGIDLTKYNAAALEHVDGLYRLYYYGDEARGVFRDEGLPVLEPIPIRDEWSRFKGLLLYNENHYKEAVRDWERYFEWRANRNENRWHGKDGTNFEFDHKNMMHCMRLLLSGENILKNGEPIVRFQGDNLEYLKGIRNGKFAYEKIMAEVEQRMKDLEGIKNASTLPHSSDKKAINRLYLEIVDEWEQTHSSKVWS